MGAKHAKWFVNSHETTGWLRETELVPKTQGIVSARSRRSKLRAQPRAARQGAAAVPAARRAKDVKEARDLHDLVKDAGTRGRGSGSSRARTALAKIEHVLEADPDTRRRDRPGAGGKSGGD